MSNNNYATRRRDVLRAIASSTCLAALGPAATTAALAQQRLPAEAFSPHVTQLLDMSPDQQQLSRDYATGIRLAFAEAKKTSGLVIELNSVETDGSPAAAGAAIRAVRDDPRQVALIGTVGEGLALASISELGQARADIAHVAPWLGDSRFDSDPRLFSLFASREDQIRYALKNLATVGVSEMGIVYPSPRHAEALRAGTEAVTAKLQVKARVMTIAAGQDVERFASTLPTDVPEFILFMGGAIELALFTHGLAKRGMQRYVVCLSDVDTTTFLQLQPGKSVPVIFTQVVPNPGSSKVAVVRTYRDALQKLFDEAPTPVSLAGYLAGRYAAGVLASAGPGPSRAKVLAEFQRRRAVDLDGWRFDFADKQRASSFVSQTMLSANGSFLG